MMCRKKSATVNFTQYCIEAVKIQYAQVSIAANNKGHKESNDSMSLYIFKCFYS